jgi:hypothetical protein
MTITSAFATITNSIAALSIPGVNTKDIDEIPQSANLITPVLLPQPNDFVTDFSQEFLSLGSNGTAKINFKYTLNYVFLYAEAGSGVGSLEICAGLIRTLSAILVAFASNDAISGLVDLQTSGIGNIGIIEDPSGNQYWGILLSLRVLEYAQ